MATTTVIGNVITAVKNNIATIKSAIGNATTSAAGLMSNTDKSKLDGIASNANKTTIVNNLTATTAGSALDAVQGKALSDSISSLNSSLANKWHAVGTSSVSAFKLTRLSGDFNNNIIVLWGWDGSENIFTQCFKTQSTGWLKNLGSVTAISITAQTSNTITISLPNSAMVRILSDCEVTIS